MTPGLSRELQLGAAVNEAKAILLENTSTDAVLLPTSVCKNERRASGRSQMDGGIGYQVTPEIRSHGSDVVTSAGKDGK